MKTSMLLALAAATLAACGPASASNTVTENRRAAPAAPSIADSDRLVVVELFQSQGCSSCPPANRNVNMIAGRDDILALSFAVTYWDRLGWKDTFAKPEFTQRQRDYAQKARGFDVATPQVVVNGRQGLIGQKKGELDAVIADATSLASGLDIVRRGDQLLIGEAASAKPSRSTTHVPLRCRYLRARTMGALCPIATSCGT